MRRSRAAASAAVACVVLALAGPGASAEPEPTVEQVHAETTELYHRAEQATEAYNAASEQVKSQQKAVGKLTKEVEKTQTSIDELKQDAGALARAQYRSGGLPPEAQLLLSEEPNEFLDNLRLVGKHQRSNERMVKELYRKKSSLEGYAADAGDLWDRLESDRKEKSAAKKAIKERIEAAEKLEDQLSEEDQERLRAFELAVQAQTQAEWLSSGILDEVNAEASAAGKRAIRYASEQLGKPYQWGAEGPETFDCSGLTMRAWQSAGHGIPRTSQQQWQGLKKIDIQQMRPGDLIIYQSDASHVGIYAGKGQIIHAPRPGRQITLAGAGTMPILAVVRPDA